MIALDSPVEVFVIWHNHQIFSKEAYKNTAIPKQSHSPFYTESTSLATEKGWLLFENDRQEMGNKKIFMHQFFTKRTKNHFLPRMIPSSFIIIGKVGEYALLTLPTDSVLHGDSLQKSSYTLYTFKKNVPVRICVKTRNWHSMSSRRESRYYEYDFIYTYKDSFSTYLPNSQVESNCQNIKAIKTTYLRKNLF